MSKLPARETNKLPFTPKTERILTLVQVMFPMVAAVATAIWAVNGYLEEQAKSRGRLEAEQRTRLTEARRPFLELQLKTYTATSEVAGRLASLNPATKDWQDARQAFYALYWSQLSLVEDEKVKTRMVLLERSVQQFVDDASKRAELQKQVYCLAIALKASIAAGWQLDSKAGSSGPVVDPDSQRSCPDS